MYIALLGNFAAVEELDIESVAPYTPHKNTAGCPCYAPSF